LKARPLDASTFLNSSTGSFKMAQSARPQPSRSAFELPLLTSLYLPKRQALVALVLGALLSIVVVSWTPSKFWPEGILLAFALSWASLVDIDRFILPNAITIGLVVAGLIFGALVSGDVLSERALGAITGYASLVAVAHTYRLIRHREGLGRGDAKFFAAGGAWLGWASLPWVLVAASISALIYVVGVKAAGKDIAPASRLVFGPFIAAGIWLAWLVQIVGQ
jgi:leader peptidase (prepilin peptidase) / N-methyltransferase